MPVVKRFNLKLATDGSGYCSIHLALTAASIPFWHWVMRIWLRPEVEVFCYKHKHITIELLQYHWLLVVVTLLHLGSSLFTKVVCENRSDGGLWSVPFSKSKSLSRQQNLFFCEDSKWNSSIMGWAVLVLILSIDGAIGKWHFVKFLKVSRVLFSDARVLMELPFGCD